MLSVHRLFFFIPKSTGRFEGSRNALIALFFFALSFNSTEATKLQYNEYWNYLLSSKFADDPVFITQRLIVQRLLLLKGSSHVHNFFLSPRSLFTRLFIRPSIKHPTHFQFSFFLPFIPSFWPFFGGRIKFALSLFFFWGHQHLGISEFIAVTPCDISHKPLRRCTDLTRMFC